MNTSTFRRAINVQLLVTLASLLCGCDTASMGAAALVDTLYEATGDKECHNIASFIPPPPLKIDGILINNYLDRNKQRNNIWMPLNILVHDDSEYVSTNTYAVIGGILKNLRYVEVERPPRGDLDQMMPIFVAMGGDPQRKYLRFLLAADTDPACEPFKRAVNSIPEGMFREQLARSAPSGKCIAARAESESISDYALRVINQKDDRLVARPASEGPALWQIVDRRTNAVYTQLLRRIETYSCPPIEVRSQFWNLITSSKQDM